MIKKQFFIGLLILFFVIFFGSRKAKAETETSLSVDSPLVFSEVLPDPEGDDKLGEFVEIQNISQETINLVGWKFEFKGGANSSPKIFEFPSIEIKAGEYQAFYYQITKIQFTNSGGEFFLYAPGGDLVDNLKYPKAENNQSWARVCVGESWLTPSPGAKNPVPVVLEKIDISPPAINLAQDNTIHFSLGVSSLCEEITSIQISLPSPISKELFLAPDGQEFTGSFEYQAFQVNKAQIIEFDILIFGKNDLIFTQNFPVKFYDDAKSVVISEIYPSPSSGQDEFIELYNQSSRPVDLTYYYLDDSEKGSQPFELSHIILPRSHLVFFKDQTKIALNNDGDLARLLLPDGQVQTSASYQASKPGWSYAKFGQTWRWSEIATPGTKNEDKIYPLGIYISEILPNPKGNDSELEFIELYNSMDVLVDLSGWILSDTAHNYVCENIAIASKSYMAIFSRDSKISLNNSSDWAVLENPRGDIVSKIHYSFAGQEDQSYALLGQNFVWTLSPTPGAKNILVEKIVVSAIDEKVEEIVPVPEKTEISQLSLQEPITIVVTTTTTKIQIVKPKIWEVMSNDLANFFTGAKAVPRAVAGINAPVVLGAESQRLTNPLIFVMIKYASLGLFYLSIIKIWRHIIQKMRLIQKE